MHPSMVPPRKCGAKAWHAASSREHAGDEPRMSDRATVRSRDLSTGAETRIQMQGSGSMDYNGPGN